MECADAANAKRRRSAAHTHHAATDTDTYAAEDTDTYAAIATDTDRDTYTNAATGSSYSGQARPHCLFVCCYRRFVLL